MSLSVSILLTSVSTMPSLVSPTVGGPGPLGRGRGPLLKITPSEDTAVSVILEVFDSRTIIAGMCVESENGGGGASLRYI